MKFLKNILLILICSQQIIAQDNTIAPKYSNEFLAIGVGADALGMGNAFVAQTAGASSSYWNPAGLLGVNKWLEVNFMHSEYRRLRNVDDGCTHQRSKYTTVGNGKRTTLHFFQGEFIVSCFTS